MYSGLFEYTSGRVHVYSSLEQEAQQNLIGCIRRQCVCSYYTVSEGSIFGLLGGQNRVQQQQGTATAGHSNSRAN